MAAGQKIGYVRVSTVEQNAARQLADMVCDRIFEDRASGKDTNRPKLIECINYVREGDTLVIHSMDRLGRNVDDLRRIVNELTGKGVAVQFVKEGLTFSGEASPMNELLLSMLGAVAQFERSLILERQREGIQIAKAAGKYRGRKPSLTPERIAELRQRAAAGEKRTALAREFKVSRASVYIYLGEKGAAKTL